MRLKVRRFKKYAKQNGIKPEEYIRSLVFGKDAYPALKKGCRIGYEAVRKMYNNFGEKFVLDIVDFEGETLNGFKAKYIELGDQLY